MILKKGVLPDDYRLTTLYLCAITYVTNKEGKMKLFNTLTFDEVRTGHFQAKQQFGNYQLSVVLLPGKTLYEAAVFDQDMFVQLPGIHDDDDVIPGLTPDAVNAIMLKLKLIEMAQ